MKFLGSNQRRRSPSWLASTLLCLIAVGTSSQEAKPPIRPEVAVRLPAFDVISIKPASPQDLQHAFYGVSADEYRAVGVPLWITILAAYFPGSLWSEDLLTDLPSWVKNENYTVIAKVAASDLPEWARESQDASSLLGSTLLQKMLKQALAQRCSLSAHPVPFQRDAVALFIGKRGIRKLALRPSTDGSSDPWNAVALANGAAMIPTMPSGDPKLVFFHTSMTALAAQLSQYGMPVVDRTGIEGRYGFVLWKLSDANDGVTDPAKDWDFKSLGLRSQHVKLSVERLVVDRVERPSPN
jgi:uncharacterized protein (TIGR03435 family)